MNEKLQYADMLEIPVSTTSITYKRLKKRRAKKKEAPLSEQVKMELIDKVNSSENVGELTVSENSLQTIPNNPSNIEDKGSKRKFSFVSFQICVIVALVAIILVSTAVNPNSGINVFLNQVFGNDLPEVSVDERTFDEFKPVFASSDVLEYVVEEGNTIVSGNGSAYSPVDGIVESIAMDGEGKYSVTVSHSENFSTVISGLTFCYANVGDEVKSKIPLGYSTEKEFSLCFLDGEEAVVTDYQIVDNQVVWGV